MTKTIAVLPGDGIGPEVTTAACDVLKSMAKVSGREIVFESHEAGGSAIDSSGSPLPEKTIAGCKKADAVFLGAVGGPRWDNHSPRPEAGLLALRKELQVFANLRPVSVPSGTAQDSPLRPEIVEGVDLLILRELTGGIYFGQPRGRSDTEAFDTMRYSRAEIERVARIAFEQARLRRCHVTSVDKANVLDTSRLWRKVVSEVAENYPDCKLEHQLVDSAAMALVTDPKRFDVILTGNLFGDILSDEAAVITGSLGNLPSASIGENGPGLFEPIHGSAPDIAGQGIANPVGAILSAAMLCELSFGWPQEAKLIRGAVNEARRRFSTSSKPASTSELTAMIIRCLDAHDQLV